METDPSEHVGTAELAKLLEESRRRAESALDAPDMHPHLATCLTCREQFEDLALLDRQLDRQMKGMRPVGSAPPQGDCPGPPLWREMVGGLTPPGETLASLEHASRCDHCGPLLREAVAEVSNLNGETTEAERTLIDLLESARAEWQQRLAQHIAGTTHSGRDRQPTPWWKRWLAVPRLAVPRLIIPRLAMAGASLLAIVAVGSWVVVHRNNINNANRNQPAAAGQLLARAYTEKRTLELRIAGASYAPLRVSRGPDASFTNRPAALLKAESLIAAQLASHPDDPPWLQAQAQADMLEGKYDAAVEALRRALELEPHSPALLIDLATAYSQRAQQENRKEDFGAAYEYLSQALNRQPDDPIALFNRAIVAENQFLYHQALDDWDHYLRVDPASQWAAEARQAAERVRTRLKEHDASQATPLLSPAQIAAMAAGVSPSSEVDKRIEEYLHEAVRTWLPQAFPESGIDEIKANAMKTSADPHAAQALFFLADLTNRQHGDRWLADLLRSSSTPHFPQAVTALARAVGANDAGEYDVAHQQADLARQFFRASGNNAGALRAQFEETYSEQMTRRTEECRRNATTALAQSELFPYSWLQIQLGLEKGVCSLLGEDDWGADERFSRRAMDRAREGGYDGLYLRALFFIADDQAQNGDLSDGLKSVDIALGRYWSAPMPAVRGYTFYNLLGLVPEFTANRPHLVMATFREATTLVESNENLLVRAWAHSFAARAAASVDEPAIAEQQYAEAVRLFALAPKTEAIRNYILWNEIHTAGVEARDGQFESGIARLTRIQNEVRPRSDKSLEETFYATLGDLDLRSHHAVQAEEAFRPALESVEQRLSSLNSETDRINWSKEAAPVYLGMVEAELVQGHAQESLDYFEWYLGAASRPGKSGRISAARTASLSSQLPQLSGQTVIAYAALPDGLAIWTYDNRGLQAQWVPQSNQDLQELAARFYALASDPRSELTALRRDSQSLFRALIAPVVQKFDPGRTIVIEADGWLAQVPFEALLDSSGHYLIERAPIVHSLPQSTDASLHEDVRISKDLHALIVGSLASSPTEGLVPLPDVLTEADAVARNFHSPEMLKGSDATLGAVERALPAAGVFHFTGHSIARPNGAALMLTVANAPHNVPVLLGADKLRRLDLHNMQLAVLSTCNTESGSDGARGFNSIAEALQRAGVPHVVASRWAVDSVETRRFVEDFYRSALSGQPVSEAIRQASRNMMADSRTSHPYYWSAFSAYGRP